jgi:mRNA interferase MazF
VSKRGDVYMAQLDAKKGSEPAAQRPVIVVSRDALNQNSPVVIVVPVTDAAHKKRVYPSHVVLKSGDGGLTKESVALGEQVRAIGTSRLMRHMGHLTPTSVAAIGAALRIALDL